MLPAAPISTSITVDDGGNFDLDTGDLQTISDGGSFDIDTGEPLLIDDGGAGPTETTSGGGTTGGAVVVDDGTTTSPADQTEQPIPPPPPPPPPPAPTFSTTGDPNTLAGQVFSGGGFGGVNNSNAAFSGSLNPSASTFTKIDFGTVDGTAFTLTEFDGSPAGGILLTTGTGAPSENASADHSVAFGATQLGADGDGDLDTHAGATTFDSSTLTFDVTTPVENNAIVFQIMFGTEAFPASSEDIAAIFVDGTNVLTLSDGGNVTFADGVNDEHFVDNTGGALNIAYDGLTAPIFAVVPVTGGATHTIKIGIADTGNNLIDSGLFVAGFGLGVPGPEGTGAADILAGDATANSLDGRGGNDFIFGLAGDDILLGGAGADNVEGGVGADTITGGAGRDMLIGGAGADTFNYVDPSDGGLVVANVIAADVGVAGDTVISFESGTDRFTFVQSAFGGLPAGLLTDGLNFSSIAGPYDGTNAGANTNHAGGAPSFIFSLADETLYYDPDGTGAGYVVIATTPNDVVTAADIKIVNGPPELTAGDTLAYTENDTATVIDPTITITDVDDTTLVGATVSIGTGFVAGGEDLLGFIDQLGITGGYSTTTGVLTLSGTATLADYETALESVTYENTSEAPSETTRVIAYQVDDGAPDNNLSNAASATVTITAVNDAPLLEGGDEGSFTEGDAPAVFNGLLTITDADSTNLVGATVTISDGFDQGNDVLGFTNQNGISGSYNGTTGVLTLSGSATVANYETAIKSVTYSISGDNPTSDERTIGVQVDDGAAVDNLSNTLESIIFVTTDNDPPTVTAGATLGFTEGDGATVIDATVTVGDPDSTNISGATVAITTGFVQGEACSDSSIRTASPAATTAPPAS